MHNFKEVLIILAIILFGSLLRIYKLDSVPNGFYVDEAAIGYNAYSFLETGKDEYGKVMPVFLRSFGAYSSPLYSYLTALPISIWGLNVFSVRLLSAVCGILSIWVFYLIFNRLKVFKSRLALYWGIVLYTISPWDIFFSRGAYEASLALLLLTLGIYFLISEKKNLIQLILAATFISISTYAYPAERLIAYLLFPGYLFFFEAKTQIKVLINRRIIFALVIFILIQLPQLSLTFTPAFTHRAAGLFYSDVIQIQSNKIPLFIPRPLAFGLSFTREFLSQSMAYFSPRNLFSEGDADLQRSIPQLSVLYPWMIIPYLVGFYILLTHLKSKSMKFVSLLAISFVIPAALTKDPFSTLRSLPLVLPVMVIITLGLDRLVTGKFKIPVIVAGIVLLFISLVQLWRSYFVLFPNERAGLWGYGYGQLTTIIKSNPDKHYVLDQSRLKPSYIELLFYMQYPPEEFQRLTDPAILKDYYGLSEVKTDYSFSNIEIRNIDWEKDPCINQVLVGDELAVSQVQAKEHYLSKAFTINDPLGYIVFQGYQTGNTEKCHN